MTSLPQSSSALPMRQQQKPDNITIAFTSSEYPTPYGDNSIPGNHPGYRQKRLGRMYAPDPINGGSLGRDLYLPKCRVGPHDTSHPTDIINVQRALFPRHAYNFNYVLDSVNGGKRHFDEMYSSERMWRPSMRQLQPMVPAAELHHGKGRAYGTYNCTVPVPKQHAMMQRREREAVMRMAGKAIVERPPDHHPVDLGLSHIYSSACRTIPSAAATAIAADSPAKTLSAHDVPGDESHVAFSGNGDTVSVSNRWNLPSITATPSLLNETRMRGVYLGTRRQGTDPLNTQNRHRKREAAEKEAALVRLEEIRLVQLLPK